MPEGLEPMGAKLDGYSHVSLSNKTSTGIPKLDLLLLGGLKQKGLTILIGPSGEEMKLAAIQFAASGIANEQPVIYVTTDIAPQDIESTADHYGTPFVLHTGKLLKFIDCYSWTLGSNAPAGRNDLLIQGPSALNDLAIALSQSMPETTPPLPYPHSRVIIHSLSTLLLYNNPEIIFKFLQITGSRLKSSGASVLLLLESGMHDEKVLSTLQHLSDEIIEIKDERGKKFIRAPLSGVPEWVEFTTTGKGLELI